jgi:type VI secretion system protein ImpG
MSDALLPFYRAEIEALQRAESEAVRGQAGEFARSFPKLAERLRISGTTTDDPHVDRLLEGVAFLGARVRHRLEDEFPELTDALLGVLYPHYLSPFPSCTVARFTCAQDRETPVEVKRGTMLEAPPVSGEICQFRTASPLLVWPVEVEQARLYGVPFPGTRLDVPDDAKAALHITLACVNPEMTFQTLGMDRLRLFLGPNSLPARQLLELLCGHTLAVSYTRTLDEREKPRTIDRMGIEPVGFAAEDALLPWPARAFSGFRLLSEYFAFPDKFLFIDLCGIPSSGFGNRMEVIIYFDQDAPELTRTVNRDMVRPGCAPLVNLFRFPCEPIPVDHTAIELRVTPDRRRRDALEVWSVEAVTESWEGGSRPWRPFYRLTRFDPAAVPRDPTYVTVRRSAGEAPDGGRPVDGTEVFLAPCETDDEADRPARSELTVDAWCSNRDLPKGLTFGPDGLPLAISADAAGVTSVIAITPVSHVLRPRLRERRFWRLISHLSLGHLSLVGAGGVVALREVLRLYNLADNEAADAAIETLVGVSARPGTARVPGLRPGAFCRGLNVDLVFDQRGWQAYGLYPLASVLERFLALHGQVNSFVRTRALLRDRQAPVGVWPPRAGNKVLL